MTDAGPETSTAVLPPAPGRRDHKFHPLRVARVVTETEDEHSYELAVPAELQATYAFRAGQFVTVRVRIDGLDERRDAGVHADVALWLRESCNEAVGVAPEEHGHAGGDGLVIEARAAHELARDLRVGAAIVSVFGIAGGAEGIHECGAHGVESCAAGAEDGAVDVEENEVSHM